MGRENIRRSDELQGRIKIEALALHMKADAFEGLSLQGASSGFIVALQTDIERKRDGVVRIETRAHSLRLLQAAHDESRTDQEDERERDLGDDQRVPQAGAAKTSHRRFIFQSRYQRRFRRLQSGNEAE